MDWFTSLTWLEMAYVTCASLGGGALLILLVLTLIGGADLDADVSLDVDLDLDVNHGSDFGFQWLSVQSVAGFLMMFGLAGMTILKQFDKGVAASIVGATACGSFTGWVIYKMFQGMKNLESSGNINMNNAVGQIGRVYVTVNSGDGGRVEIVVQDKLTVYDAVSENKEEIPTGQQVKVVGLINNKVLKVVRA